MLKRILSAAIAIPIGIAIIALNNELLYYIVLTVISVIAVYELMAATKYIKSRFSLAVTFLFVAVTPFLFWIEQTRANIKVIYFSFVVILLVGMLFNHRKVRFEQVALVSFVAIAIPLALCSIAFIRTKFPDHAMFLIVYTMVSAWIGDAGAYFVGTFLGKHKMCPEISPKKTWEGFVGGIVTSGVSALIMCYVYEFIDSVINNGVHTFSINIPYLVTLSLVISVLGVVGDLSASLIKRECSVKDFGNIIPGHGGVLDRFDSVLLAAPFAYMMYQIYFPITQLTV